MPQSSTTYHSYKRCTPGYKLYCGENVLQLFDKKRANSFVFMTRPPAESGADIVTSIALQKISGHVLQVGTKLLCNERRVTMYLSNVGACEEPQW